MTETDSQGVVYTKASTFCIVGNNTDIDNNAESTLNSIVIPSIFNGIIVKIIGKCAFRKSKTLKSIFIPNTIEELKHDCFSYASSLETVLFADNSKLKIIEIGVFFCTNIAKISLPTSIKSFGYNCFGKTRIEAMFSCGRPTSINSSIFGTSFDGDFYSFPTNLYVNNHFPYSTFGDFDNITRTDACHQNIETCRIIRNTFSFVNNYVVVLLSI